MPSESLDSLRAEVEAEDKAEADKVKAEQKEQAQDPLLLEAEGKEVTEVEPAESEVKEPAEETTDSEDWMKGEGDDVIPAEVVVDNGTAKAIRLKYQGQAKEAKAELEVLRRENEELRKQKATVLAPASDAPKRDDFNTDEEFQSALVSYAVQTEFTKAKSSVAAETRKQQQEQMAADREKEVEAHYTRAAVLAGKSKIKPEVYQAADLSVRTSMASIFGEAADTITDELIARVGPGSEKAMYYLGVNPSKQKELLDCFRKDPNGLAAAVYLTRLAERLNTPKVKESSAPEPIDEVKGDKSGAKTGGDRMKKDYDAALSKGDAQSAYNIKAKAKNLKVDTKDW